MSRRHEARQAFYAFLASPWSLALGALLVLSPLLLAFHAFAQPEQFDKPSATDLVLGKELVLGTIFPTTFLSLGLVVASAAGAMTAAASRDATVGSIVGTSLAVAVIIAFAWLLPMTILVTLFVGIQATLPPVLVAFDLALESAAWIALFALLHTFLPRAGAAAAFGAWALFTIGIPWGHHVLLASLGLLDQSSIGFTGPWTLPLSFAGPSATASHFRGAMLPSSFDPERTYLLETYPGLYSPVLYLVALLAWILIPLLLASASARRAEEDAALDETA